MIEWSLRIFFAYSILFIVTVILVFFNLTFFVRQIFVLILIFFLLLELIVQLSWCPLRNTGTSEASSHLQVKQTQGFGECFGGLVAPLRTEERRVERSGTHFGNVVVVILDFL
jgi:hypothetical protein